MGLWQEDHLGNVLTPAWWSDCVMAALTGGGVWTADDADGRG